MQLFSALGRAKPLIALAVAVAVSRGVPLFVVQRVAAASGSGEASTVVMAQAFWAAVAAVVSSSVGTFCVRRYVGGMPSESRSSSPILLYVTVLAVLGLLWTAAIVLGPDHVARLVLGSAVGFHALFWLGLGCIGHTLLALAISISLLDERYRALVVASLLCGGISALPLFLHQSGSVVEATLSFSSLGALVGSIGMLRPHLFRKLEDYVQSLGVLGNREPWNEIGVLAVVTLSYSSADWFAVRLFREMVSDDVLTALGISLMWFNVAVLGPTLVARITLPQAQKAASSGGDDAGRATWGMILVGRGHALAIVGVTSAAFVLAAAVEQSALVVPGLLDVVILSLTALLLVYAKAHEQMNIAFCRDKVILKSVLAYSLVLVVGAYLLVGFGSAGALAARFVAFLFTIVIMRRGTLQVLSARVVT